MEKSNEPSVTRANEATPSLNACGSANAGAAPTPPAPVPPTPPLDVLETVPFVTADVTRDRLLRSYGSPGAWKTSPDRVTAR